MIPLNTMVLVGIIEQHLKKAVLKISTAICTCPSHSLVHPNLYGTIFGSLFQDQVIFFLVTTKNDMLAYHILPSTQSQV